MKSGFVEKTLHGTFAFLKQSVFADEHAVKKGLLQSFDARARVLTLLLFVVLVVFVKSLALLACLYAFCLALCALSGIGLAYFLKRTLIFVPLFSVFIAAPALFSQFTPGEKLAGFSILGVNLIITKPGFFGAARFLARVTASISFAALMSLTTRHSDLLKVLRVFRVPKVFVMVLGMCYRYIYLLLEIIDDTHTAIKSRAGAGIGFAKGRTIAGWSIANLWQRSEQLNASVYDAMLSRGYTGEPVTLNEFKSSAKDVFWVAFSILAFIMVLYADR